MILSICQPMRQWSPLGSASAVQYAYLISGLRVHADVHLPSAFDAPPGESEPDVRIREGRVDRCLGGALRQGPDWEAGHGSLLLRIAGVANVLVTGGREITYQTMPGHDPGDLTLYVLGSCFATLLQQRGAMVLHASAVAVRGRAVLFCGPSGAGKSTLAAMLSQRGYPLLNDDVCSVTPTAAGYTVHPDGRRLKLWGPTLDHLKMGALRGPAVRENTDKFYTTPVRVETSAKPIAAIYILESPTVPESTTHVESTIEIPENTDAELRSTAARPASLNRLPLLQSMLALRENSYRPALVQAMELDDAFFRASAALQGTAGVFRLCRPMEFQRAEEAVSLLEQQWAGWSGMDGRSTTADNPARRSLAD